jgi:hypothetical protein
MSVSDWSRHARQRAAQRAIPEFHLELLQAFGETVDQKGGSVVLRFAADRREQLRRQLADALAHWDQLQSAYAVIAPEGQVITVAHAHGRTRRHRRRSATAFQCRRR